jgi:two-component system, chemotaxis family, protein-glutamate methylesterase/glutaminase
LATSVGLAVRVLMVADDYGRTRALRQAIEAHSDLQVVGIVSTYGEALRLLAERDPDVVTVDVDLGDERGCQATRAIMAVRPLPILVVGDQESHSTFVAKQMLAAGAREAFLLPRGSGSWARSGMRCAESIRSLAATSMGAQCQGPHGETNSPSRGGPLLPPQMGSAWVLPHIVAMVSSTGGPRALHFILSRLAADYPVPIVIVQHIATGFAQGLARWLDQTCPLRVQLVDREMDMAAPGVYLAPDDRHLLVRGAGRLALSAEDPASGITPCGDVMLSSVARAYGQTAIGIILTGMGRDGVQGLAELRRAGATTIAQDQASSAIYGMPKVAAETGVAAQILSLEEIVAFLHSLAVGQ